mmetsp:Transcript_21777/g.45803  ORF Transcript_21777/g.45803 Transcript_21777/m.45803 type:complete len:451 (+) Transcript_21777:343-1695(+)
MSSVAPLYSMAVIFAMVGYASSFRSDVHRYASNFRRKIPVVKITPFTQSCYRTKLKRPFLLYAKTETMHPMIVVGNINSALGGAMALCARDILIQKRNIYDDIHPGNGQNSPVPPTQSIIFFNQFQQEKKKMKLESNTVSSLQNALLSIQSLEDLESLTNDHYREIHYNLQEMYEDIMIGPIVLHTTLDSIRTIMNTANALSRNGNSFSLLGFDVRTKYDENRILQSTKNDLQSYDNEVRKLSRDDATQWGETLQHLIDECQIPTAITMDMATHLAMLRANSLPKSRGLNGNSNPDVFAINDDIIQGGMGIDNYCCDGILFEYQYDYQNMFGGMDPLLCPSKGYSAPSPISFHRRFSDSPIIIEAANDAFAAAFTAMMGSSSECGMDSTSCICIATAVKAVFAEMGNGVAPPDYSWSTIERVVQYSRFIKEGIIEENGASRKKYKEFGYF